MDKRRSCPVENCRADEFFWDPVTNGRGRYAKVKYYRCPGGHKLNPDGTLCDEKQ